MSYEEDSLLNGFADGYTLYTDSTGAEGSARIVVQADVRVGGQACRTSFIVDTGGLWNILSPEMAEDLGIQPTDERTRLTVRGRVWEGFLTRLTVTLSAVKGATREVEGTFFIPDENHDAEWAHPNFLGYAGMLGRIRFAVDPIGGANRFFFGVP